MGYFRKIYREFFLELNLVVVIRELKFKNKRWPFIKVKI